MNKGAVQAGTAVDIARQLESRLEKLGATGKGLHERTTSTEGTLPEPVVKKLRFIASVRNKLVHEDGVLPDKEFFVFTESGRQTIEELDRLIGQYESADERPKSKVRKRKSSRRDIDQAAEVAGEQVTARSANIIRLGATIFFSGLAFVFLLMLLGFDGSNLWGSAFLIYFIFLCSLLVRRRQVSMPELKKVRRRK